MDKDKINKYIKIWSFEFWWRVTAKAVLRVEELRMQKLQTTKADKIKQPMQIVGMPLNLVK